MSKSIGSSKQEFGHDLNAAAFNYDSAADDSANWARVAKQLYGIYFHFSTAVSKRITISLTITSSGTRYTIHKFTRVSPSTEYSYIWHPNIELPQNVDIIIQVSQAAAACSMNMITVESQ